MAHLLNTLSNTSFTKFALFVFLLVAMTLPGVEAGLPKCSHGCKRNKYGKGRCKHQGYVYKCRLPGQNCVCSGCRSWCPKTESPFKPASEDQPRCTRKGCRPTPSPPVTPNEDDISDYIYDYEEGTYHHVDAPPTDAPNLDEPEETAADGSSSSDTAEDVQAPEP